MDLGATGRLSLMAKLAEGTGMKLPQAASDALNVVSSAPPQPNAHQVRGREENHLQVDNITSFLLPTNTV